MTAPRAQIEAAVHISVIGEMREGIGMCNILNRNAVKSIPSMILVKPAVSLFTYLYFEGGCRRGQSGFFVEMAVLALTGEHFRVIL